MINFICLLCCDGILLSWLFSIQILTLPNKNLRFRIGSLFPAPGQAAKFMQVYFLSTADQFTRRRSIFEGLSPELIHILTNIMNEFNPYVTRFKSAVSVIRNSLTPNLKAIYSISILKFNFNKLCVTIKDI